jgi:hypothetical protein
MFNLNLIQQHVNSANSGDVDNDSVWLSLWFGQLSSKGHGTRCHGVQFNKEWTKIPMAIWVWYTKGIYALKFCGHFSSSQEFVTVGINLGTV